MVAHRTQPHPSRRRGSAQEGYALPLMLAVLAVGSILAAAGFLLARLEVQSGQNALSSARAFLAAESGLAEITAWWDPAGHNQLAVGATVTLPTRTLPRGGYVGTITRLSAALFMVESSGWYQPAANLPPARRALRAVVRLDQVMNAPRAALTVIDTVAWDGVSLVEGQDTIPPGWSSLCQADTAVAGLARAPGTALSPPPCPGCTSGCSFHPGGLHPRRGDTDGGRDRRVCRAVGSGHDQGERNGWPGGAPGGRVACVLRFGRLTQLGRAPAKRSIRRLCRLRAAHPLAGRPGPHRRPRPGNSAGGRRPGPWRRVRIPGVGRCPGHLSKRARWWPDGRLPAGPFCPPGPLPPRLPGFAALLGLCLAFYRPWFFAGLAPVAPSLGSKFLKPASQGPWRPIRPGRCLAKCWENCTVLPRRPRSGGFGRAPGLRGKPAGRRIRPAKRGFCSCTLLQVLRGAGREGGETEHELM